MNENGMLLLGQRISLLSARHSNTLFPVAMAEKAMCVSSRKAIEIVGPLSARVPHMWYGTEPFTDLPFSWTMSKK